MILSCQARPTTGTHEDGRRSEPARLEEVDDSEVDTMIPFYGCAVRTWMTPHVAAGLHLSVAIGPLCELLCGRVNFVDRGRVEQTVQRVRAASAVARVPSPDESRPRVRVAPQRVSRARARRATDCAD